MCKAIAAHLHLPQSFFVQIHFVEATTMAKMCKAIYPQKTNTDVLAWPTPLEIQKKHPKNFCGEIFLNFPWIAVTAKKYHHSWLREASFLCTHGILHLLGYDHQTKAAAKKMFALTEQILTSLKITRSVS